jgi:CheY-like chemotaxis protein
MQATAANVANSFAKKALRCGGRRLHTMTLDTQRATILVVDDNHDIRSFAKLFLERAGYAVITASDGVDGLRCFEQHQSNLKLAPIMLLLTDVTMPNMNGMELVSKVLGIDPQLAVLFMSGDARKAQRGWECLVKPFRPAELVDSVSRLLNANKHSNRTASAA